MRFRMKRKLFHQYVGLYQISTHVDIDGYEHDLEIFHMVCVLIFMKCV